MRVTAVMDMFFVFWNAEVRDTSLSSESTKTNDKQWSFAAQCRFSEVCLKFRASEQFFTNLALSNNQGTTCLACQLSCFPRFQDSNKRQRCFYSFFYLFRHLLRYNFCQSRVNDNKEQREPVLSYFRISKLQLLLLFLQHQPAPASSASSRKKEITPCVLHFVSECLTRAVFFYRHRSHNLNTFHLKNA